MNIPLIWIAAFVALCIFYYYKSKEKIRRHQRRDQLDEKAAGVFGRPLKKQAKGKGGRCVKAGVGILSKASLTFASTVALKFMLTKSKIGLLCLMNRHTFISSNTISTKKGNSKLSDGK